MLEIFRVLEEELQAGRPAVLATIVSHRGSTPRTAGARMAVRADGSFVGTIGGGKVEAEVLVETARVFREGKNRVLAFRLQGQEAADADMLCGGELTIYLEYYPTNDPSFKDFLRSVSECLERGEKPVLVVPLEDGTPAGPETKGCLFPSKGKKEETALPSWQGSLEGRITDFPLEGSPVLEKAVDRGKEKIFYLERLAAPERLILFGAGHISAALCPLAKGIGFRVTVTDDRPEFAHPSRFPRADKLVVLPFVEAVKEIRVLPADFVVIMTRGHLHDQEVLRQVLPLRPAYIGMIGSRRKREVIFRALQKEDLPGDLLQSVHTPIGLSIGAETPEEIAVSIAAELIQVRAEKRKKKR